MANQYSFPGMIDPGMFVGLQSMDFGELTSPDGRSHSVDAYTPVQAVDASAVTGSSFVQPTLVDPNTGQPTDPGNGMLGQSPVHTGNPAIDALLDLWSTPAGKKAMGQAAAKVAPSHWLARLVFILIAIGLIIIVAARLTLTE